MFVYETLKDLLSPNVGILLTSCNSQLSNQVVERVLGAGASLVTLGENYGCDKKIIRKYAESMVLELQTYVILLDLCLRIKAY